MQKCELNVTGMSCSACSSRVEKVVRQLSGVGQADVNLLKNTLTLSYDEGVLTLPEVKKAVEEAGYGLASPIVGRKKPLVKLVPVLRKKMQILRLKKNAVA